MEESYKTNNSFNDTSNHWASSYIETVKSKGIINGYSDNTFKPDNKVTRAEAIVMISKMSNREPLKTEEKTFKDVSRNHWAYEYIESAVRDLE